MMEMSKLVGVTQLISDKARTRIKLAPSLVLFHYQITM